jgi:hypothetical protein
MARFRCGRGTQTNSLRYQNAGAVARPLGRACGARATPSLTVGLLPRKAQANSCVANRCEPEDFGVDDASGSAITR